MTARALTTAAETALAFERLAATARQDLLIALPHLTPDTPLHIPDLRAHELETWADLLGLLTRRGVALRLLVADCDPVIGPDRHRAAWSAASGFADVVQGDAQILCAPHGQEISGLRSWRLRRHFAAAVAALKAEDPGRLTKVQRDALSGGPRFRPVEMPQSFVLADGKAGMIGGPDLSLAIQDADICGALGAHFADCWSAAMAIGVQSLAAPATAMSTPRRPQSRADLRLLRTLSRPAPGIAPRPQVTDHETALTRLINEAQRVLLIRTPALRHDGLTKALTQAAGRAPELQLILLLRQTGDPTWDPARANALQADALNALRAGFGDRFACLSTAGIQTTGVLVDDEIALVGSAALTRRACRWNTEASALVRDASLARHLMNRFGAEALGVEVPAADLRHAETWRRADRNCAAQAARARSPLTDDFF